LKICRYLELKIKLDCNNTKKIVIQELYNDHSEIKIGFDFLLI